MINAQEIRSLPLRDKLQMFETLWDEIAKVDDGLDVPEWQKELLDRREQSVEAGEATFLDWEDAKQQIDNATQ